MDPRTVPSEYSSGNGSFSGYWLTLAAATVFQYETMVTWSAYGCFTGHPIGTWCPSCDLESSSSGYLRLVGKVDIGELDFTTFHEGALVKATSILQSAGKIHDTNIKPMSVQTWK